MDHFAGLDVSVKDTNVCIVDGTGRIVREVKVASEPEALLGVLKNGPYHFKRIGLEAGPLSQWLFSAPALVAHRGGGSNAYLNLKTISGSSDGKPRKMNLRTSVSWRLAMRTRLSFS